ncbi:hypothetical protein ACFO4P_06695 [Epilithonimonas pallida]|uniref:RiboL-PSP-HEPN domain-containing protein n=1 Tax=Epilithonimonas pallida TaxID=373671 RepID=A0ABY1R8T2_9FLAO|nr:hypothetical protein [Epilithonimonas pallida]SMP97007.1 hypothetical protein SAMN05421679_11111 [Epilithonimonas pallida]
MKRDIINEIKEIKSRNNDIYEEFYLKINRIEKIIEDSQKLNDDFIQAEILRYSVINIVACSEALSRSLVKELIDNNESCFTNIKKINQFNNFKIDITILTAFQTKTITIGDLVAHALSYNNFEDITSNINNLRDSDIIEELKKFQRKYLYERFNEVLNIFKNNPNAIIKSVKEIFKLRHILCHEYANNIHIDYSETIYNLENFKIFLECCFVSVTEYLQPNYPETQFEINQNAKNNFEKIEKEFLELLEKITNSFVSLDGNEYIDKSFFLKSINDWKNYAEYFASSMSVKFIGGSMYDLIYYSNMEEVYKSKIELLKKSFTL